MKKLLGVLLFLLALPTHAEQFNFTIPLKLDHLMPTVKAVKVECRIFKAKPPDWMGTTDLVASWNQDIPLWPDPTSTQDVSRPKPGTPFLAKQEGSLP